MQHTRVQQSAELNNILSQRLLELFPNFSSESIQYMASKLIVSAGESPESYFTKPTLESSDSPSLMPNDSASSIASDTTIYSFKTPLLDREISVSISENSEVLRNIETNISKQSKKIKKDENANELFPMKQERKRRDIKRRKPWTKAEDDQLLELVDKYKDKWCQIAKVMKSRTRKQIRDRYINVLRPNINLEDWTPAEIKILIELYQTHGRKWCSISKCLPGRTENQVKNWFQKHQNELSSVSFAQQTSDKEIFVTADFTQEISIEVLNFDFDSEMPEQVETYEDSVQIEYQIEYPTEFSARNSDANLKESAKEHNIDHFFQFFDSDQNLELDKNKDEEMYWRTDIL